jgi:hypothetical protein
MKEKYNHSTMTTTFTYGWAYKGFRDKVNEKEALRQVSLNKSLTGDGSERPNGSITVSNIQSDARITGQRNSKETRERHSYRTRKEAILVGG